MFSLTRIYGLNTEALTRSCWSADGRPNDPDPILATQSEPIDEITEEVKTLAHDMLETMVAARGIGLAANQVGVTKRLIVVDLNPFPGEEEEGEMRDPALGPHVMINPEIVAREGSIVWEEGCLSVPEEVGGVERSAVIQADFTNLEGHRLPRPDA